MTQKEIYKKLLNDYQNLNEDEKKAILIYKSELFYHINSISTIENISEKNPTDIFEQLEDKKSFIEKYESFKKKILDPKNSLINHMAFKKIDFNDIYSFIESVKDIYSVLENAKTRITLPEKLIVYRGCSYNEKECDLSKGNLISTTIDPEVTEQFLFKEQNNKLYSIMLEKGTPVLVTPLSILSIYDSEVDFLLGKKEKQLKISNEDQNSQQEVIVFKDSLNFEINSIKKYEDDNLEVIKLLTTLKKEKDNNIEDKNKITK